MKRIILPVIAMLSAACSCQEKAAGNDTGTDVVDKPSATIYTTSTAGKRMEKTTVTLGKPEDVHSNSLSLNGESFQTVDGFGFAVTQASCYNLLQMSAGDRSAFLEEVFSVDKGIGSSLIRVCIGGSDFSMDEFTWCDTPGIENFAVHELDEKYLFPILDEIFRINPGVRIIASPWSCPRWMKVGDNLTSSYSAWTGGHLNPLYYKDYATYFVKWIQEMEKRGYPIYAVTLQNEPLNRGNSMSMYMGWEEQRDFIKTAVGPAFEKAGLGTKILLFDHNYNYDGIASQQDYPIHILEDADAARYIAGSAWHNYGGNVSVLDKVHSAFPDKDIYFTEASIGTWNYNFNGCLINDFRDIFLGTLGRFGKGVTLWNMMLDSDGKPYRPGGCATCFGAVTLSAKDHSLKGITRNSHYYNVAHCSKVIRPGAVRLGTKGYTPDGVICQWYRNTDGSNAVIILNQGSDALLNLVTDKVSVPLRLAAGSIQSVTWTE